MILIIVIGGKADSGKVGWRSWWQRKGLFSSHITCCLRNHSTIEEAEVVLESTSFKFLVLHLG